MKFLDTSVLLEFFSGDEETIDRIDAFFRNLEKQKEKLLITEEVVLELVYYLEKVYGWEREVIADILSTLLSDSLFKIESRNAVGDAVKTFQKSKLDFIDCLKIAKAKRKGAEEIVSLRRAFQKGGMRVVRP